MIIGDVLVIVRLVCLVVMLVLMVRYSVFCVDVGLVFLW